jgi:enoyl-CoA hydratase/carnithine racemase
MTTSAVATATEDGVLTVWLDRPERRNALDPGAVEQFCAVLDDVDARDDVRAVVVTGRGNSSASTTTSRRSFAGRGHGAEQGIPRPAAEGLLPRTEAHRSGQECLRSGIRASCAEGGRLR